MSDITYPDVEFVETDTETIISNMIALYEELVKASGREDYKVRPEARKEFLYHGWRQLWCNSVY